MTSAGEVVITGKKGHEAIDTGGRGLRGRCGLAGESEVGETRSDACCTRSGTAFVYLDSDWALRSFVVQCHWNGNLMHLSQTSPVRY